MTLPPTSPPAIERCGDTPVFQSPGDRREQHKSKPRLISDIHVGQPGSKGRSQREAHGPSQARGVRWGRTVETVAERDRHDSSRSVIPRHDFGHFGWPFRHPGRTPRQKNDLGELYMTQTRPRSRKGYVGSFVGARSKTTTWGVCSAARRGSRVTPGRHRERRGGGE